MSDLVNRLNSLKDKVYDIGCLTDADYDAKYKTLEMIDQIIKSVSELEKRDV